MTKKQDLINGLAKTLEIDPTEIMIYKQTGQPAGYTVILTDYRKYTGIQPDYKLEEPDQTNLVDVQGVSLPAEYVPYYTNPKDHDRAALRDLAAYLDIPDARKLNKNVLVKRIKDYKQGSGNQESGVRKEEPLSIEQASKELFD